MGFSRVAVVLALCIGCRSGAVSYSVSGTVTLDGVPVSKGHITFYPADKSGDASSGKIEDGKYSLMTPAGAKRVEIIANRPVPAKTDALGMPLVEQYIPPKYNIKSTLTVEVSAQRTNHDFPLTSK
jgi:hypothetical protein